MTVGKVHANKRNDLGSQTHTLLGGGSYGDEKNQFDLQQL